MTCPLCQREHSEDADCVAPPLWPHQTRAMDESHAYLDGGGKAACIVSPTGGGKGRLIVEHARQAAERGKLVGILTSRKLLSLKASEDLEADSVGHGMMAAGWKPDPDHPIQIASLQTIWSRVYERVVWELPKWDLLLVDEAHQNMHATALRLYADVIGNGGQILLFTATPVGIKKPVDRLIIAGTNSELRKCGALVPAVCFAPDEPDLTRVTRNESGEFVTEQVVKRVMVVEAGGRVPRIFGSVEEHLFEYNPKLKPTILFAPDVPSSRFFAEELTANGIPSRHIDAETPMELREQYIAESKSGECKVICNRFVCREGVNMPWLAHCCLATAFGGLSNLIQSVGRVLRAYPGMDHVTIQDHGGNFIRHNWSPNQDMHWQLGDTDKDIYHRSVVARQRGKEQEAIVCPKCHGMRRHGTICPHCGNEHTKSVRCVLQAKGKLKRVTTPFVKYKREKSEAEKIANSCFYMAIGKMTCSQLDRIHYQKTGRPFPDGVVRGIKLPDRGSVDWDRKLRDVYPWAVPRRRQTTTTGG